MQVDIGGCTARSNVCKTKCTKNSLAEPFRKNGKVWKLEESLSETAHWTKISWLFQVSHKSDVYSYANREEWGLLG